jgi:hypothetical protein
MNISKILKPFGNRDTSKQVSLVARITWTKSRKAVYGWCMPRFGFNYFPFLPIFCT